MSFSHLPPLASIEAVRPVFLIVTGVFLAIIAWRIAKNSGIWTARTLISGAFMLCLGYAVILPGYAAGLIPTYHPAHQVGDPANALAWIAVQQVVMNGGWLVFGFGIAMHAGLIRLPSFSRLPSLPPSNSPAPANSRRTSPHEAAA
ncbi:MAG: hypothetical protein ACQCXQ_06950 [Verrucomicrobiales bacterium]